MGRDQISTQSTAAHDRMHVLSDFLTGSSILAASVHVAENFHNKEPSDEKDSWYCDVDLRDVLRIGAAGIGSGAQQRFKSVGQSRERPRCERAVICYRAHYSHRRPGCPL